MTDIETDEPSGFSVQVGQRLRAVRRARGLSLDEAERSSGGRWSASAIGAYERGFRNLSLPRLRDLAEFYDVPMTVLLGEGAGPGAAEGDARRPAKLVLDLVALDRVEGAGPVCRYLRTLILARGDYNGRVLSVRNDDVRALCAVGHWSEAQLFEQLRSWGALVDDDPEPASDASDAPAAEAAPNGALAANGGSVGNGAARAHPA